MYEGYVFRNANTPSHCAHMHSPGSQEDFGTAASMSLETLSHTKRKNK